jgi:hypothetical protein
MMGDGRHRGQPIQVRSDSPAPSPIGPLPIPHGICKFLPHPQQAPNEPLPYIYSLGGAAMPFVALRPRDTISYFMPEDTKRVRQGTLSVCGSTTNNQSNSGPSLTERAHPFFTTTGTSKPKSGHGGSDWRRPKCVAVLRAISQLDSQHSPLSTFSYPFPLVLHSPAPGD